MGASAFFFFVYLIGPTHLCARTPPRTPHNGGRAGVRMTRIGVRGKNRRGNPHHADAQSRTRVVGKEKIEDQRGKKRREVNAAKAGRTF